MCSFATDKLNLTLIKKIMKFNKILLFVAVAGTALFPACKGGGIDDALKAELSSFEADWGASASKLTNMGADLQKAIDNTKMCNEECSKKECKKDMKATCDSLNTSCKGISDELASMKTTYDEAKKAADETGKKWGEWKAKVDKGEVKAEEVKTELDGFKKSWTELDANMNKWSARLGELTAQCKANCESMEKCCPEEAKK
jgi:chromosome segregation ATPase